MFRVRGINLINDYFFIGDMMVKSDVVGSVEMGRKKEFLSKKQKDFIFVWAMLSVAILNFLVFWVYVNIKTILMAFQEPLDNGTGVYFTLAHFQQVWIELTTDGGKMLGAFKNTMSAFVFNNFISFPITIVFSYFLFKKVLMYRTFRVVFFLPSVISAVVMTTMFKYFIGVDGPVQRFFELLGGDIADYPMFLNHPSTAFGSILFYDFWSGIGYSIIIMSGAIYRIPNSIFESAKLDGITMFREFINMVLPLIWPTLSTYLVFRIAGVFTYTGPILLFTDGAYNTYTIGFYIFEQVKYYNQLYYPSAVSLFWTALGIPLVFICRWFIEKFGSDIDY